MTGLHEQDELERLGEDVQALVHAIYDMDKLLRAGVRDLEKKYSISSRGLHILGLISLGFNRPNQLVQQLSVLPSVVTFETDKLENAKLIRREHDKQDRRAIILSLTQKGDGVRNQAVARTRELLRARIERISPARFQGLLDTFAELLKP
jgi:DNA-binding MarR family transcriptional regulator